MNSQQNKDLLFEFEKLIIKFTKIIEQANDPINLLCFRCNCCFLTYKNLFHVNDQMEQMLEQTYDGRRFAVKANDSILLDGMFFPFNKEKVKTVDELAQDIIKDGVGYDIEK